MKCAFDSAQPSRARSRNGLFVQFGLPWAELPLGPMAGEGLPWVRAGLVPKPDPPSLGPALSLSALWWPTGFHRELAPSLWIRLCPVLCGHELQALG